jgi:hypothetical protein
LPSGHGEEDGVGVLPEALGDLEMAAVMEAVGDLELAAVMEAVKASASRTSARTISAMGSNHDGPRRVGSGRWPPMLRDRPWLAGAPLQGAMRMPMVV